MAHFLALLEQYGLLIIFGNVLLEQAGLPLPAYEVVERSGPAHAPNFTVEVKVRGFEPERGEGGSRQSAEKAAAQTMLLKREGVESEASREP